MIESLPIYVQLLIALVIVIVAVPFLRRLAWNCIKFLYKNIIAACRKPKIKEKARIDTVPTDSLLNVHQAVLALREHRSLRRLADAEDNRKASELPTGIYVFVTEWDLRQHINFQKAKSFSQYYTPLSLQRNKDSTHCFEVHKWTDTSLHLVGFTLEHDLASIKEERSDVKVRISPLPIEGADKLVEIDFAKIKECENRDTSTGPVVDLAIEVTQDNFKNQPKPNTFGLSEYELAILKILIVAEEHDRTGMRFNEIHHQINITKMKTIAKSKLKYYLEELNKQRLINISRYNFSSDGPYSITQKGRKYLVSNGLL